LTTFSSAIDFLMCDRGRIPLIFPILRLEYMEQKYQRPTFTGYPLVFAEQKLHLHPDRAVYWEDREALLIADMHLGKMRHFVRNGIPLPGVTEAINLGNLQELLLEYQPKVVYILGDLFHSDWNEAWDEFALFVEAFEEIAFHLVLGNHDILSDGIYEQCGLQVTRGALFKSPFLLVHIAEPGQSEVPTISGHIHPGAILQGRGKQSIKLPCFWIKNQDLILPAFGHFTGLAAIKAQKEDRVFVIAEREILDLSHP